MGTSIGANLAVVASMKMLAKTFVAISPRRSPVESLAGAPAAGMKSVFYLVSENDGAADVRALHDLTAEPRGIHVYEGVADHGVSESIYLSDLDGNGIELTRDRPESEWPRDANGNIALAMADPLDLNALLSEAHS